jgi:hypothetical protein
MDKDLLIQLVASGQSQYQIAKRLGKAQTTVRYWLRKYQLRTQRVHRCARCGETDPANFPPGRYTDCRRCRKRFPSYCQTARFRSYKRKAVPYKGGCCEVCGYNRCMAALVFHHKDPSQKDPKWYLMRNWTFERIKNELDKCMLVCRNCHAEIHYGA